MVQVFALDHGIERLCQVFYISSDDDDPAVKNTDG